MSTEGTHEDEDTAVSTKVYFTDGSKAEYPLVIRRYDSDWLYALRDDSPANHCILNTTNVIRVEGQAVRPLDEGVAYCNFDWVDEAETIAQQELWTIQDVLETDNNV